MKRIIFFSLVLVLVALVATPAVAQEQQPAPSAAELLRILQDSGMLEALRKAGVEVNVRGDEPSTSTATTQPAPTTAPATPPTPSTPAGSIQVVTEYGAVTLPPRPNVVHTAQDGYQLGMRMSMGDAGYARAMAYQAWRARSVPSYSYSGGYGSAFPSAGLYGAGPYGFGLPWMEGCQDGRPAAYLEFQYRGRRDEKHLWLVSINGIGVGTVDQGDTLSQKLPICSDAAVVVTVEKIGEAWSWERQYSLRPLASTEVPIGEFLATDTPRITRR